MAWLEQNERRLARTITSLSWVADGIEKSEREGVQELVNLATFGQDAFRVIAGTAWVADGITPDEASVVDRLSYTAQDNGALANTIAAFAWIADGITSDEVTVVDRLSYTAQDNGALANTIAAFPWIADGIEKTEASVVNDLSLIAQKHDTEALRIAQMPFLTRLGPADIEAMDSLASLSYFKGVTFKRIMAHSTLRAGISDDWAKIVALLYGVAETNPQLIDALLDPNLVTLEEQSVVIPLSGVVVLAIVRLGGGAARSMDLLEHAVRSVSSFMATPFPKKYVALLFADAVSGSFAGTNFGTHVAVMPEYDVDDGSHEANSAASVIAHEVAHYYWSGNLAWVDEGASEFMAAVAENARIGRAIEPSNPPCDYEESIGGLEKLGASGKDTAHVAFKCNYSLGERFFIDLYQGIGDAAFRRGLKSLYMASELEDGDESTVGTAVGITHVRKAFGTSTKASTIIDRWY